MWYSCLYAAAEKNGILIYTSIHYVYTSKLYDLLSMYLLLLPFFFSTCKYIPDTTQVHEKKGINFTILLLVWSVIESVPVSPIPSSVLPSTPLPPTHRVT